MRHEPRLVWSDPSPAAALARRLIEELATVDPARLRRRARPECDLIVYDTTRSRIRRYHAEDPSPARSPHPDRGAVVGWRYGGEVGQRS